MEKNKIKANISNVVINKNEKRNKSAKIDYSKKKLIKEFDNINKHSNNPKQKLLNPNMSIALKNYNHEKFPNQKIAKYKQIYPEMFLNNPKRYIEIVNDNCFHLEMNLKLLGLDDEFIKESQQINNMNSSHNPFLKYFNLNKSIYK